MGTDETPPTDEMTLAVFEEAIDKYLFEAEYKDNSMLTTGWVLVAESAIVDEEDTYGISFAHSALSIARQLGLLEYAAARLRARIMDITDE